jgi:catechol 2,3-dioxygenase-like lactoylglutathione lyase family enzyme
MSQRRAKASWQSNSTTLSSGRATARRPRHFSPEYWGCRRRANGAPSRWSQPATASISISWTGTASPSRHFAFLVSEAEFDAIFGRIRERGLSYWADPARTKAGEINTHDGGRGVYFPDPDGHLLEIITRPYGSSGWQP